MGILRAIAFGAVSLALSACATTMGDGKPERSFHFGSYDVVVSRMGCAIPSVKIINYGPTIPNTTIHTLTIAANGATSAVYTIACEPVMANGRGQCTPAYTGTTMPAETAGLGCPGWNQYNMN